MEYNIVLFLIFLILVFFIFLYYYEPITEKEPFFDYDWSSSWSEYDKKARESADCKPIYKIHMKLGSISSWVWIVKKSCEQGLPHTRGHDVIAIPVNYPKELLPPLMDHERVHLLQRRMPDSWAKFYRIKWNYEIYNSPPFGMPDNLIKFRRANPDTENEPYVCWKSRYWSVPVYISESNLSLKEAPIKWWDQATNRVTDSAPEAWIDFFGEEIHQCEHPHELSAEYLSGPLRLGNRPAKMPDGMKLLAYAWNTTDPMFPSIDS
jgi:hypothetical protein